MLLTDPLTPDQQKVLDSNFERFGHFYVSADLHPMLDCASAPDGDDLPEGLDIHGAAEPASLGFANKGLLREEFFGGIWYDLDNHRHYMLDQEAYAAAAALAGGSQVAPLPEGGGDVLDSLTAVGILAPGGSGRVRTYGAEDLTRNYLQAPLIVEVELTYGCFRTCRHCAYESSPRAARPDELSAAQWKLVFEKLAGAGVAIVQLTGGDPFFRDDIFEILEAADEAELSVYVRSDTVALSKANVERVLELENLWHVGTSIDGADAETHDALRGEGAFTVLERRIRALGEAGVPLAAGATLHKGNFRTVREIGRVTDRLGATWFDIGFLSPVGRARSMADEVLDAGEIAEALDLYLEGARAGDYRPSHAHYRRRAAAARGFDDLGDLVDKLPYLTEWPFNRMRVDPTGSTYTAGKLKGSDYAGGFDVLNGDVHEVWRDSPNLVRLRELGGSGRIHGLDYRLLHADHQMR